MPDLDLEAHAADLLDEAYANAEAAANAGNVTERSYWLSVAAARREEARALSRPRPC